MLNSNKNKKRLGMMAALAGGLLVAAPVWANWSEEAKLTASNGVQGHLFAFSISISGDCAIAGAPDKGPGSAYIYVNNNGTWVEVVELAGSLATAAGDSFGWSVSIDGDYAVVGADGENGSGAAYVFANSNGSWTEVARLTGSDTVAEDDFGWSVAIRGEYVVVGAIGDDDLGGMSGSVYVYKRPPTGWVSTNQEKDKLTASDAQSADMLGYSVSIDGDTIIAGAPGDDDNCPTLHPNCYNGSAYIFERDGGAETWSQVSKLTPANATTNGGGFGESVSISGEVAIVGRKYDSHDCPPPPDDNCYTGAAYIFVKPPGGWGPTNQETAKLTASDFAADNQFGGAVAISGDYAIVGAMFRNDRGAAYVYEKPAGGWVTTNQETNRLTSSDLALNDWFGHAVALDEDYALVGAYADETDTGAAYVFRRRTTKWVQYPDLTTNAGTVMSDASVYKYLVADDFQCTLTGPITDIRVWGAWQNDFLPDGQLYPNGDAGAAEITLSIHDDIASNGSFSKPGNVLWFRTFYPGEYSVQLWQEAVNGWWLEPGSQCTASSSAAYWQYTFPIDPLDAFPQRGTAVAPVVYWLDVQADPSPPGGAGQGAHFWWAVSDDHWNDDAVWAKPAHDPFSGPWYDMTTFPSCPVDPVGMAFGVSGQEHPYKWIQYPDLTSNGIDVNASSNGEAGYAFVLADDFECKTNGLITGIDIWGSWNDDVLPGADAGNVSFTLSVHEDDSGQPGSVLWYQTFEPEDFGTNGTCTARAWVEGIEEGWLDSDNPGGYTFPADTVCWRYRFSIDPEDAFHQQGTPAESVVYWLDVQAVPANSNAFFGWKTSVDHWNDEAVWGDGQEPYTGPWNALTYPPAHSLAGQSIDLAFALTSPTPDCNINGIADDLDISGATSADCNTNGVPDECDIASGVSTDSNTNGIPDECEEVTCTNGLRDGGEERIDCGGPCPPCECTSDLECDNDEVCDGTETCDAYGNCQAGTIEPSGTPCPDDGNECTDDECDGAGNCTHPNNSAPCDDGEYCNGADTCSGGSCSQHAGDPCVGGGECNETCNEGAENCYDPSGTSCGDPTGDDCTDPDTCDGAGTCQANHASSGTPCPDALYCNGAETCDGSGICQSASYPCTVSEWCDESTEGCVGHGNGDFEPDSDVDLADFAEFQMCFDQEIVAGSPCEPANLIGSNGIIDLDDYALLHQGFTGPESFPPSGMVLVPGGEFEMGCHEGPIVSCFADDWLPPHNVSVDSFYMDVYEVTNQQYCAYLNSAYGQGAIEVGTNGVVYKAGDTEPYCNTYSADLASRIHWDGNTFTITSDKEDHPMVHVSWYGVAAYANWRSQQHGRTPCYDLSAWTCDFDANGYRLPTEAEWEYAARGGHHNPYYTYPWGNYTDGSKANYWVSYDPYETGDYPYTTPVGYYDGGQEPAGVDMANGYGLYDMAGNVWEWCYDWHDENYYADSPCDNPQGPASGTLRVMRGGSWGSGHAYRWSCAHRLEHLPDKRGRSTGFRVVAGTYYRER
ncbi:MAG: SUMF1/EgtB/PvdO family nonheme iron enzyme [Phycisphaerae bacterium]|nr:SUMF1/EgtB/PvdO family nonheme iron enzyme [Phycisphaerae bacterium]